MFSGDLSLVLCAYRYLPVAQINSQIGERIWKRGRKPSCVDDVSYPCALQRNLVESRMNRAKKDPWNNLDWYVVLH